MIRFDLGPLRDVDPVRDLVGYTVTAPLWTLMGVFWFPAKGLNAYAEALREASQK